MYFGETVSVSRCSPKLRARIVLILFATLNSVRDLYSTYYIGYVDVGATPRVGEHKKKLTIALFLALNFIELMNSHLNSQAKNFFGKENRY